MPFAFFCQRMDSVTHAGVLVRITDIVAAAREHRPRVWHMPRGYSQWFKRHERTSPAAARHPLPLTATRTLVVDAAFRVPDLYITLNL